MNYQNGYDFPLLNGTEISPINIWYSPVLQDGNRCIKDCKEVKEPEGTYVYTNPEWIWDPTKLSTLATAKFNYIECVYTVEKQL
jgi:hypothetical protein